MKQIKRLLVANRGEIAVRIMRTAKKMGITTIAIYSDADKDAPHVLMADEAFRIGPPPAAQSYLLIDTILEIAQKNKVDAIHPGYGFVSENAAFARKVAEAGIVFVGPSADAIHTMGDKLEAKQAVQAFDVPLVPGSDGEINDLDKAMEIAEVIGFPVLIKAAAGGGGKGMRIVYDREELGIQMKRAASEALSAFGNPAVFIEKYVESPRHIEIQVLADLHGNTLYLFERECSIQRRHQKVIEEAPSVIVDDALRKEMGEAAVKVCKACQYTNAGTVEFIVDTHRNFYFLEMNTRLQVEHPVTEMITGVDLVEAQLHIAEGKALSFKQEDLHITGHAIEVRVYAEDPRNNFLPDIGTLSIYHKPKGEGIRVDDGYREGMEVPIHYDPMLAKLIVHAQDRETAIQKMLEAITQYEIYGVETTLGFCQYVLRHSAFVSGDFDTHFVAKHFDPQHLTEPLTEEEAKMVSLLAERLLNEEQRRRNTAASPLPSPWKINRTR